MRERKIDQLPLAVIQMGTEPANQACALPGNQISDLLVYRMMPNQLSCNSQGSYIHS